MKKVWRRSRTDNANDNGVRFETPQFPQATSIDDIVAMIESSEVDDLLCHSFGKLLGIATDGVPEIDRRNAIFLVCLVSSFQQSSFEKSQHIWTAKGQPGNIVQSKDLTRALREFDFDSKDRMKISHSKKRNPWSAAAAVAT